MSLCFWPVFGLALLLSTEPAPSVSDQPASKPGGAQIATTADTLPAAPTERLLSLKRTYLTGDWGGLRPRLAEHGVTFAVFLNDQYQSVVKGGADTNGSGRNSASVDAIITFDLGKLAGLQDAEALLHLQSNWGAGINPRTGALLEVNDDADGDLGLHVGQLWFRQHFFDRKLSLTVGFLDFQTVLDRNAYANSEDKQFWHQSLDNNPFVPLNIGLGASLAVHPVSWYTLTIGTGDAQSVLYKPGFSTAFHDEDWFMAYVENTFQVSLPSKRGPLPGGYRFGVLYDPRPKPVFRRSRYESPTRAENWSYYASLDQMIYREGKLDDQGLGVFARFGYRSPETNRMSRFWSGGFQYKGMIPERDADVLGFAFSLQRSSHLLRSRVDDDVENETIYELYYAIQVAPWLVITPDIQYVDNPGAEGEHGHAVTAGVRMRVSF